LGRIRNRGFLGFKVAGCAERFYPTLVESRPLASGAYSVILTGFSVGVFKQSASTEFKSLQGSHSGPCSIREI
jgi:hypothetical protein